MNIDCSFGRWYPCRWQCTRCARYSRFFRYVRPCLLLCLNLIEYKLLLLFSNLDSHLINNKRAHQWKLIFYWFYGVVIYSGKFRCIDRANNKFQYDGIRAGKIALAHYWNGFVSMRFIDESLLSPHVLRPNASNSEHILPIIPLVRQNRAHDIFQQPIASFKKDA